jgi:uncharacterized delta-60 repeat protein
VLLAAGILDPAFGPAHVGTVAQSLNGTTRDYASAVAVQPDGKIVAAGTIGTRSGRRSGIAVARYRPDGSPDPTFGPDHDGHIVIENGAGGSPEETAIAIAPDGRIVVSQNLGRQLFLARLTTDGSPDPTFGTNGLTVFDKTYLALGDVAVRPDGRILIGGSTLDPNTGKPDFYFAQFNPDGTPDATFGPAGDGTFEPTGKYENLIQRLELLPDGRVIAAGGIRGNLAVTRLTPDGRIDKTFGRRGFAAADFGTREEFASGLAVTNADGIVLGGTVGGDLALAAFTADGATDASFGTAGKIRHDLGSTADQLNDLLVQPGGRLVAVGQKMVRDVGQLAFAAAGFTPDGKIDRSFGTNGQAIVSFTDQGERVLAAAMQPDGRILLTGPNTSLNASSPENPDFELARLTAAGAPDSSFGPAHDGRVVTPFHGPTTFDVSDAARLPDGSLLTVGNFYNEFTGHFPLHITRFRADGTLDTSFGDRGGTLIAQFDGHASDVGLAVLPDGRFVVAATLHNTGTDGRGARLILARFHADGSPDRTFGPAGNGVVTIDPQNGSTTPYGSIGARVPLALDAAGGVVVAVSTSAGFELARFTTAGAYDTTFGTAAGAAPVRSGIPGATFDVERLTLDPAGRIVVVGQTLSVNGLPASRALVARFTSDGRPDASFGAAGVASPSLGGSGRAEWLSAVVIQPDGRIVIAGGRPFGPPDGYRYVSAIARLNPDGTFDASFGVAGRAFVNNANNLIFDEIALVPGGRVLALGRQGGVLSVARVGPNGLVDSSFGQAGIATTDFGPGHQTNPRPTRLIVQPDGKVVAIASAGAQVLLARYQDTSTPPPPSPSPPRSPATSSLSPELPPPTTFDSAAAAATSKSRASPRSFQSTPSPASRSARAAATTPSTPPPPPSPSTSTAARATTHSSAAHTPTCSQATPVMTPSSAAAATTPSTATTAKITSAAAPAPTNSSETPAMTSSSPSTTRLIPSTAAQVSTAPRATRETCSPTAKPCSSENQPLGFSQFRPPDHPGYVIAGGRPRRFFTTANGVISCGFAAVALMMCRTGMPRAVSASAIIRRWHRHQTASEHITHVRRCFRRSFNSRRPASNSSVCM